MIMDKNLDKIAIELFGKIRTQFPSVKLRDKDEEPTDVHKEARFFEFDFEKQGQNLGTITISIDDNPDNESDGLVVMFSQNIADGQPTYVKRQWFRFLESLSDFASRNFMEFNVRDITKSNLDKRDRNQLVNNSRGDNSMTESKLWGTSKTSFQKMGEATLIVRHTKPVNYNLPAGRTMHIDSIYVENIDGERFKYPYKHLNGARALATHVAHGGNSYDSIGKHIISLSEELNKLRMFKNYVDRNPMVSEAMGNINSKVYSRIDDVKKEIFNLQNSSYYQAFAESFTDNEDIEIPEDIVNDWIDRLTIRTFNEELKNVFPYIYKLVGEEVAPIKELGIDDLIGEESTYSSPSRFNNTFSELEEFENFISGIDEENALLNVEDSQAEAINKLNELMVQEIPVGTDGVNAIESLQGIIDDKDLMEVFKELGQVNPETDARPIIKTYLEKYDRENGTTINSKISFNQPQPGAPVQPAAQAQPAAPVAEADDNDPPFDPDPPKKDKEAGDKADHSGHSRAKHLAKAAMEKAKKAGAKKETLIRIGGQEMTLGEAAEMIGLDPDEFFIESKGNQEVIEFVKSMFDENTGQFPKGEEGVKIAVEKEFGEGASQIAERVMAELGQVFESNRIMKLAGLR